MFQNELPTMLQTLWKGHMSHSQKSPPTFPGYVHSSTASQVFEERQKRLLAEVEAERSDGDSRAQRLRQELRRLEQDWHWGYSETEYGDVFSSDMLLSTASKKQLNLKTATFFKHRQFGIGDGHRMLMKSAPVLVLRAVAEISSWPSWRDFDEGPKVWRWLREGTN